MYVYKQSEPGLWTVGFYDPKGKWQSESDYDTPELAAKRVDYLNGGATKEPMDNLRKLLDEGKMHYFVSWMQFGGCRPSENSDIIWIPAQGVINRHPFEFIKDQRSPTFAVLLNWKEITEEEYELYSETFKHS